MGISFSVMIISLSLNSQLKEKIRNSKGISLEEYDSNEIREECCLFHKKSREKDDNINLKVINGL